VRILYEDADLLAVDKPGTLVCHPSKAGPWSSLIGAAREYTGLPRLHMPSRLDRETSGVVVLAKTATMGSALQIAIQERRVEKQYLAILTGHLCDPVDVDQPLGKIPGAGPVYTRMHVTPDGASAQTRFEPLAVHGDFTLARVIPHTGRMHQIRAHAHWLGHPIVGDKIYGPDERWYLHFIEQGITPELLAALKLPRQALHCTHLKYFLLDQQPLCFEANLAKDLKHFLEDPASSTSHI
jgi:23S rRNA pseudouridine1911/1915/1917 synthase